MIKTNLDSAGPFNLSFVNVGPQRTASTWLYLNLQRHPAICFPCGVKETMFFDQRFDKGDRWYQWHFRHARPNQICGEIAPTYFHEPLAAERIRNHSPRAKIVINIRNPIERCHSLFRHHLSKGRVPNDFPAALKINPSILSAGQYHKWAPVWERAFANQVHYLVQEDVGEDPERSIHGVCRHAGIEVEGLTEFVGKRVNSASAPRNRYLAWLLS